MKVIFLHLTLETVNFKLIVAQAGCDVQDMVSLQLLVQEYKASHVIACLHPFDLRRSVVDLNQELVRSFQKLCQIFRLGSQRGALRAFCTGGWLSGTILMCTGLWFAHWAFLWLFLFCDMLYSPALVEFNSNLLTGERIILPFLFGVVKACPQILALALELLEMLGIVDRVNDLTARRSHLLNQVELILP